VPVSGNFCFEKLREERRILLSHNIPRQRNETLERKMRFLFARSSPKRRMRLPFGCGENQPANLDRLFPGVVPEVLVSEMELADIRAFTQ
jgi:hypothetical protein